MTQRNWAWSKLILTQLKNINEVTDESFKQKIEGEYPELFKGIGLMDGEISIKLKRWGCSSCRAYSQSTTCNAGASEIRIRQTGQ